MVDMATFGSVTLFFALTIAGRRLRERAFRLLSAEQKASIIDKLANYTSAELIPFASLILGFLATLALRPEWFDTMLGMLLSGIVILTVIFHFRTRRRFLRLRLPASFLSEYERSRVVSYCALAFPLGLGAWVLLRL